MVMPMLLKNGEQPHPPVLIVNIRIGVTIAHIRIILIALNIDINILAQMIIAALAILRRVGLLARALILVRARSFGPRPHLCALAWPRASSDRTRLGAC